jgi:uncharacterized protein
MRIALAVAALLGFLGAARAGDLSGTWTGTWTRNGDALAVTLAVAKSKAGYSATFESDALQASDIPFASVTESGGAVHMVLKGDQTTTVFDGALSGAGVAGTFTDGPSKGTFRLSRAAQAPPPVASRDVTFADSDATLAGTLLLPSGAAPHPAILFLQGSGPEARFANHWLARKFAQAGFVALIYDKRGVGGSTGDWRKAGFDALADDAAAGIRFLRARPEVAPARVGVYGHSQGGTIAPLVAAKAEGLGFVIASAPGGLAPAAVETYSVENSIAVAKLPPSEQADARAYVRALIDTAYRGGDRAQLDAVAAKFKTRDWYFDAPPPGDPYWTISRQIAAFDPAKSWRAVKAPALLVYGEKDERVPRGGIDAIAGALKDGGNTRVEIKLYPDADHTFAIVGEHGGWPKHEPDYADVLVRWAAAQR